MKTAEQTSYVIRGEISNLSEISVIKAIMKKFNVKNFTFEEKEPMIKMKDKMTEKEYFTMLDESKNSGIVDMSLEELEFYMKS
ncbi:MAG: hypothetical protein Q4G08_05510 [Capnocytophaga sp.]|nr:hypothetical protein [Capnocytophaga sp.]